MPKTVLPLHKREGLKDINPDTSLYDLIELNSSIPSFKLAKQYYSDRAQYLILHRWMEEQLYEEMISNRGTPKELLEALQALSSALMQLAQNQTPEFFKFNRQTGDRNKGFIIRQATLAAAALYNGETVLGNELSVTDWWAKIVRNSDAKLPANLNKVINNIAGLDTANVEQNTKQKNIKEKRTLMAYYAGFTDATPEEAKEHSDLLKKFTEDILLQK
jgi:hypothetical protein